MDSSAQSTRRDNCNENKKGKTRGLTLVEVLVVAVIVVTMSAVVYGLMTGLEFRTDSRTSIDLLLSQIKSQRIRAMLGVTHEGEVSLGTAIRFVVGTNRYALYTCHSTIGACPFSEANATVVWEQLETNMIIKQTAFDSDTVVFAAKNGELYGLSGAEDRSVLIANVADGSEYTLLLSPSGGVSVAKTK